MASLQSFAVKESQPQWVKEFNQVLFVGDAVTIGRFHAPVEHPRFHHSGVIGQPTMVFPRTSVAIKHQEGECFHANEKLIAFYNKHQDYTRKAHDTRGDISDWFEFSAQVLDEAGAGSQLSSHASIASIERPFSFSHLPSQTDNFVRQRLLVNYLLAGNAGQLQIDAARVEEVAMSILSNSLRVDPLAGSEKINQRQRELAERAQFLLTLGFAENDSLAHLASQLGASVFHLCRVFKRVCGQSIHQYKNELRLRQALGRIAQGDDLNHIALDLGYSSHSHFSTAFGRYFKHSPKVIRQQLLCPF